MQGLSIKYLSHGVYLTGGAVYEKQFTEKLAAHLKKSGVEINVQPIHKQGVFKGLRNLILFLNGFRAGGDVNVVVFRMALTAMLRNLFNKKFVLAVLHNYDQADYKSGLLRIYSLKLFLLLKVFHPSRFAIVSVAPYWHEYFSVKFTRTKIFLYPNLFDNSYYTQFRGVPKKKKIHLGQYSLKNDPAIFSLAEKLSASGYECYFTSMMPEEAVVKATYSIKCTSFDEYLKDMAESEYTLALTAINEGWNRIAHESLLVGTAVIGYGRGGLQNLLHGSGSIIVHNIDEVYDAIIKKKAISTKNTKFTDYFDISESDRYMQPISDWITLDQNTTVENLVSVVMPVYNSAMYLPDAIESILTQSYTNFEFIIVNDGSTDHSEEIIQSYEDQRIKYICLDKNYGNAHARNVGFEAAAGKYVMIQDSDDMSLPGRMKIQVEFLEKHPWVGVCGSYMKVLQGENEFIRKYPTKPEIIRAILFSKNPVSQPTVMLRKDVFDVYHLRHIKYFEDFNLWYQASKVTAIANIPQVLVHYRLFDTEQKLRHRLIKQHVVQLIFGHKLAELDVRIPEDEIVNFTAFMKGYTLIDKEKYYKYNKWLDQIETANKVRKVFPRKAFRSGLLYDRLRLWKFYFLNHTLQSLIVLPELTLKVIFRIPVLINSKD